MPKMLAAGSIPDSVRWIARAVALAALAVGIYACSQFGPSCSTGDDSNPPEEFKGGAVVSGYYMSSPWSGLLLSFPGGKRYDLIHDFGCVPADVSCFESFSENGTSTGSIAPAAGNMCLIQSVDTRKIRIKNDSCSDYFVLVTAPDCRDGGADGSTSADGAPDSAAE